MKSSHRGTGDFPQNQNNSMSEDPGDGNRNSFTSKEKSGKAPPAPDTQGEERLEDLGREGAKQSG